ncbi:hypothetical protein E4T39_06169 [Aureobasidium subglaciale]|nr:hypothetical protein E4T39_06169 [Aureobasidium subglaciale]
MTTKSTFNVHDVCTWSLQSFKAYQEISTRHKPKGYFDNFFGWTKEEAIEAKEFVIRALEEQFGPCGSLPSRNSTMSSKRHLIQKIMVQERPDLFIQRHGPNPPDWFTTDLIYQEPEPDQTYNTKCVTQQFIAHVNNDKSTRKKRRAAILKPDAVEDEDEEGSMQPLNKRSRVSHAARIPTTPSERMFTSSFGVAPRPRKSDFQRFTNRSTSPHDDKKDFGRFAPIEEGKDKTRISSELILYVTRVSIVAQNLILERDRFGLAKNLFDQGILAERRLQELVFGNVLQEKPVFLWYFHQTSNDKPRAVKNRPSAEAAITLLMAHAEETGAEAIQIFDASDRNTASLIPLHEVTREKDFQERESFELEIDNDDDDDDDSVDNNQAERSSRGDSAYGSRDEELQLDEEPIKGEVDSKPTIIHEQERRKPQIESYSESEEE